MPRNDLETIEEARRYGEYMFGLFRPFLGRRILEVGAGIGTMSRKLVGRSDLVIGIEPNPNCLARLEAAMQRRIAVHAACLPPRGLRPCASFSGSQLDTVYCSNVLEHIEDDVAALTDVP